MQEFFCMKFVEYQSFMIGKSDKYNITSSKEIWLGNIKFENLNFHVLCLFSQHKTVVYLHSITNYTK